MVSCGIQADSVGTAKVRYASVRQIIDIKENKKKRFSPIADIGRPTAASNAVRHNPPPSRGTNGSRLNRASASENSPINRATVAPIGPTSLKDIPQVLHIRAESNANDIAKAKLK